MVFSESHFAAAQAPEADEELVKASQNADFYGRLGDENPKEAAIGYNIFNNMMHYIMLYHLCIRPDSQLSIVRKQAKTSVGRGW